MRAEHDELSALFRCDPKDLTIGFANRQLRFDGAIGVHRVRDEPSTRVRVVVARRNRAEYPRSILLTALDRSAEIAAGHARRALARRWPDVDVVIVDKAPVRAVLAEAERFRADAIIVGWRGHGAVRRMLMGSVSRGRPWGTLRRAGREETQRVRRIVVGLDRSPDSSRALAFVERLVPPMVRE